MRPAGWMIQAARKEAQALSAAWLAGVFAIAAGRTISPEVSLLAYVLGTATLGALALGHEYGHGTLPALLALPVPRGRILAVKLGVLAVFLAALAGVAAACVIGRHDVVWFAGTKNIQALRLDGAAVLWLPPLCAVCLAPCLTMVSRATLPGAVFSCAALALTWLAGDVLGMMRHGVPGFPGLQADGTPAVDAFRTTFAIRGTAVMCLAGMIATVWGFGRLQAIDGRGTAVVLPSFMRSRRFAAAASTGTAPAARRRHWLVEATSKELHLHSMAFVVTGLYVAAWYGVLLSRRLEPGQLQFPLAPLTMTFDAVVAVLLGLFASAEERQLGTVAWQELLPVAAWRQWAVKTAVVIALALGLGMGVPRLMESLTSADSSHWSWLSWGSDRSAEWQWMVVPLCLAALYVSSLCSTGIRALIAVPAALTGTTLVFGLFRYLSSWAIALWLDDAVWFRNADHELWTRVTFPVSMAVAVFGAAVLFRLSALNHRSAESASARGWPQARWLAAAIALVAVVDTTLEAAGRPNWSYSGTHGVLIRGRVQFEGVETTPSPEQLRYTYVVLDPTAAQSVVGAVETSVDSQLHFATPATWPGRYVVRAVAGSKGWTFKSATYQGHDVAETPIDLAASIDDVVITFTERAGHVAGRVESPGAVGATVVAFPADPKTWTNYGIMSRRTTMRSTPYTGTFDMSLPVDGAYLLVALPREQARRLLDYRSAGWTVRPDGATFAKLAALADRVDVRVGEVVTHTLALKHLP